VVAPPTRSTRPDTAVSPVRKSRPAIRLWESGSTWASTDRPTPVDRTRMEHFRRRATRPSNSTGRSMKSASANASGSFGARPVSARRPGDAAAAGATKRKAADPLPTSGGLMGPSSGASSSSPSSGASLPAAGRRIRDKAVVRGPRGIWPGIEVFPFERDLKNGRWISWPCHVSPAFDRGASGARPAARRPAPVDRRTP